MTTSDAFTNDNERRTCRSLLLMLGRFRELDGDMLISQAVVLLWVARNEGRTQRDLRASLNMPSSTASRNLAALSKVHRLGKPGLGLIEFVEDPTDRRAKQLYLTTKGKHFVLTILRDLD